jgi:ABC-type Fe3+ transport system permease subunit
MAEQTTVITEAETPEAFLADRERFWSGFTHSIVLAVVAVAIVLLLMLVFLWA